jgi:hypothetical protein
MTEAKDLILNRGIAVVIDDEIETGPIKKIIDKISLNNIPLCKIDNLEEAIRKVINFKNVSFIILDWNLKNIVLEDQTQLVATPSDDSNTETIDLIKKIKEVCFAPIFIFTKKADTDLQEIIDKLTAEKLYFEDGKNFILVRNKDHMLKDDNLFDELYNWINSNSSIYASTMLEKEIIEKQTELFWEFFEKSSGWPGALWNNAKLDGVDPNIYLQETFMTMLTNKCENIKFVESAIIKTVCSDDELKKIIFQSMYTIKDIDKQIKPGDIYEIEGKFFLNIRPECDTVRGEDIEVYLLEAEEITKVPSESISGKGDKQRVISKVNEHFILCFKDNKILKLLFKNIKPYKYNEIKDKKIARILPPFITEIQQRYSSFIGRFGTPRIPLNVYKHIIENE